MYYIYCFPFKNSNKKKTDSAHVMVWLCCVMILCSCIFFVTVAHQLSSCCMNQTFPCGALTPQHILMIWMTSLMKTTTTTTPQPMWIFVLRSENPERNMLVVVCVGVCVCGDWLQVCAFPGGGVFPNGVCWCFHAILFSPIPSLISRLLFSNLFPLFLACLSPSSPSSLTLSFFGLWVLWQSKVLVSVSVSSPDLFHVVLRYIHWGDSDVRGRVSVIEDSWNSYCGNCECGTGNEWRMRWCVNVSVAASAPSLSHLQGPHVRQGTGSGIHLFYPPPTLLLLFFSHPAPCPSQPCRWQWSFRFMWARRMSIWRASS